MDFSTVVTVVGKVVSYVLEQQKNKDQQVRLSRALSNSASDVSRAVAKTVAEGFAQARVEQANDKIQRAEEKLEQGAFADAANRAADARSELDSAGVELQVQPLYICAATLEITANDLAGQEAEAIRAATRAAKHLRSLQSQHYEHVKSRFSVKKISLPFVSKYVATLDGRQLGDLHNNSQDALAELRRHLAHEAERVQRPFYRAANIFDSKRWAGIRLGSVALRTNEGYYIHQMPGIGNVVRANSTDRNSPYSQFERIKAQDEWIAYIAYNGQFVHAASDGRVFARLTYLEKNAMWFGKEVVGTRIALQNRRRKMYLGIERARHGWQVTCVDRERAESNLFRKVILGIDFVGEMTEGKSPAEADLLSLQPPDFAVESQVEPDFDTYDEHFLDY